MTNVLAKELTNIQQLLVDGNQGLLKEKVVELRASSNEETLTYLLKAIDNNRLDDSMTLVKDLLRQHQQLAVFYDPKIGALKVELNFQESELSRLEIERDELSKEIDLFNSRYMLEIGPLMEQLLYLKLQKLRKQVAQNPDLQPLLDKAELEFEEFNSYREDASDGVLYDLSEEKKREIKRLYRKATLICHPDKVKEVHKEKAEEIFSKVTYAYKRNDLPRVKSITNYLEKTGGFDLKIDDYDSLELIKNKIESVFIEQEEVTDEIELIKNSTALLTIKNIEGDWTDYFNLIKENYSGQIEELKFWIEMN